MFPDSECVVRRFLCLKVLFVPFVSVVRKSLSNPFLKSGRQTLRTEGMNVQCGNVIKY